MKQKLMNKWPAFIVTLALMLLSITVFYSCQKNNTASPDSKDEVITPGIIEKQFSVANVYNTADGKTTEVWFYETPLVFEFKTSSPEAKHYFELLNTAKENKEVVSVRISGAAENQINTVSPATAEQIAAYKTMLANREQESVTKLSSPEESIKQTPTGLVAVVPNTTVLNTIFNTLRNQCCKAAGPYIYGQCIPFQYVADGCYARAHKMRQVIESYYGYTSYKVFNYACNGAGTLAVSATLWNNNCCVKWWYHVTSYVIVQVGTAQYAYALDPAMFTGPVSIPTWYGAQKSVGCGYNGSAQGQVYYSSNAYAPNSLNTATCTLVPFADNTYTAANATCAAYAPRQGCF